MKKVLIKNLKREEWLKARSDSIGGSEAGTIIGLNKYCHPAQLFAEKAGIIERQDKFSDAAFFGNFLESKIAELAQFIEIDDSGEVNMQATQINYEAGTQLRKTQKSSFMYFHDNYDFISGNIDRFIFEPSRKEKRGILECKTISGYNADEWEFKIPPMYFTQLQHYLMITGLQWGWIAVLIDGRKFIVHQFTRDEDVISRLIDKELSFWDKVLKARKLVQEGKSEEAWQFAPSPEDGDPEAYEAFQKIRYSDNGNTIYGSEGDYTLLVEAKQIDKKIKELELDRTNVTNMLRDRMADNSIMLFDDGSKVTWRESAKTKRRTFLLNLKAQ